MMVKMQDKTRTCSCKILAEKQSLGPDFLREKLHLLNAQRVPVGTIQYIWGLENHPNRGTDPDIQRAISLVRRTNTRRPPDRMTSSDEDERYADDEEPCHGFESSPPAEPEDDDELAGEDLPEFDRILAIARGLAPPETPPRRRSTTWDDFLDEEEAPA